MSCPVGDIPTHHGVGDVPNGTRQLNTRDPNRDLTASSLSKNQSAFLYFIKRSDDSACHLTFRIKCFYSQTSENNENYSIICQVLHGLIEEGLCLCEGRLVACPSQTCNKLQQPRMRRSRNAAWTENTASGSNGTCLARTAGLLQAQMTWPPLPPDRWASPTFCRTW